MINTSNKKPSTEEAGLDELELRARAIGERLMELHPFMQIKQAEVIDGVVLVERVDLFPYPQDSTECSFLGFRVSHDR